MSPKREEKPTMRKMQQRGRWLAVGVLGVILLGLVGCGGTSGDGNSAGHTSRVVLQITTAEQTGGEALRQAGVPNSLRAVPTDPSDPTFISRLVIEVTGAGITTITQTLTLTAAQQEQVAVELQIPTGPDGRINVNISVDAFHTADGVDTKIFHGEARGVDLPTTEPVAISLARILPPDDIPDTITTVQLHLTVPRQVVPTDPSDPAFVSRLDIQVEGEGIPTPVTRSVTLTAAQQTEVTVENLAVPTGPQRRIMANVFNSAGSRIFAGETTADLLDATVTVLIPLSRALVPEAVTPSDLANKAFAFEDSAAFGIGSPSQPQAAILQFGPFIGNTGPFTLTSAGQTASGNITILPPASTNTLRRLSPTGTPRQGETSTSCTFVIETSNFSSGGQPLAGQTLLMQPCETDALDGNLILFNPATGASSASSPPVAVSEVPPNTVRIGSPSGPVVSGETFTVPVELNAGETAVISYLFELTFNRDIVVVENITNGSAPFEAPVTNPGAFTTGAVQFAANNTTFDTAARGLLRLATITFRVVGNSGSESALTLALPSDGALVDAITFASRPSASIIFLNGAMTVQ
jgi:hypothetical protein